MAEKKTTKKAVKKAASKKTPAKKVAPKATPASEWPGNVGQQAIRVKVVIEFSAEDGQPERVEFATGAGEKVIREEYRNKADKAMQDVARQISGTAVNSLQNALQMFTTRRD